MDLVYDEKSGKSSEGWLELCKLWRGIRTLQLKIKGRVLAKYDAEEAPSLPAENPPPLPAGKSYVMDVDGDWITHGLELMSNLRRIDLSIETRTVAEDVKIAFCKALSGKLTSSRKGNGGNTEDVTVLYVDDKPNTTELETTTSGIGLGISKSNEVNDTL